MTLDLRLSRGSREREKEQDITRFLKLLSEHGGAAEGRQRIPENHLYDYRHSELGHDSAIAMSKYSILDNNITWSLNIWVPSFDS